MTPDEKQSLRDRCAADDATRSGGSLPPDVTWAALQRSYRLRQAEQAELGWLRRRAETDFASRGVLEDSLAGFRERLRRLLAMTAGEPDADGLHRLSIPADVYAEMLAFVTVEDCKALERKDPPCR